MKRGRSLPLAVKPTGGTILISDLLDMHDIVVVFKEFRYLFRLVSLLMRESVRRFAVEITRFRDISPTVGRIIPMGPFPMSELTTLLEYQFLSDEYKFTPMWSEYWDRRILHASTPGDLDIFKYRLSMGIVNTIMMDHEHNGFVAGFDNLDLRPLTDCHVLTNAINIASTFGDIEWAEIYLPHIMASSYECIRSTMSAIAVSDKLNLVDKQRLLKRAIDICKTLKQFDVEYRHLERALFQGLLAGSSVELLDTLTRREGFVITDPDNEVDGDSGFIQAIDEDVVRWALARPFPVTWRLSPYGACQNSTSDTLKLMMDPETTIPLEEEDGVNEYIESAFCAPTPDCLEFLMTHFELTVDDITIPYQLRGVATPILKMLVASGHTFAADAIQLEIRHDARSGKCVDIIRFLISIGHGITQAEFEDVWSHCHCTVAVFVHNSDKLEACITQLMLNGLEDQPIPFAELMTPLALERARERQIKFKEYIDKHARRLPDWGPEVEGMYEYKRMPSDVVDHFVLDLPIGHQGEDDPSAMDV